ncbi:MAG: hypothetical protein FH761_17725 [Firmicutes bacterium]|nr:hypothetical protein [Bacillota bacterium]
MHSSFEIKLYTTNYVRHYYIDDKFLDDIDSYIFHSQPTSFFTIDNRIPRVLRELVTESEGCLKMNFLTGASACARKAIYELLVKEDVNGNNYDERIKELKKKYSNIDEVYFDILLHIKDMTSEKVHEQSWDKWDSKNLNIILETLKSILVEIYVVPMQKVERKKTLEELRNRILKSK